jgi:alpha-tubulin suppressor-like RCC1 family protein
MSILDLGKVKFLWKGTWNSTTAYLANDVIAYNNSIWMCKADQAVGTSSEFSPGLRDRANANGANFDPARIITYDVTVSVVGNQSLFFINGHRSQQVTLLPGFTYRFYQKDSSNNGNRFALSSTIDGTNNAGTEYTTGLTYTGTAGSDGFLTIRLPSNAPATLYYYSPSSSGVGGLSNGRILRGTTWRGWQHWDQVTTGAAFRGVWNSTAQYYYNDIIAFEGTTYIALADNTNKTPSSLTTAHHWAVLIPGDRLPENMSVAWPHNNGPIGWSYPHGRSDTVGIWNNVKWITQSGRLMNQGSGQTGIHGLSRDSSSVISSHPQEICFNNWEWWTSRDNGGLGKMTTPDGQPPRVTQVETGWTYSCCLFNNGEVWKWGYGANGERGDGDPTTTVGIPRRVTGLNDTRIVKISQGGYDQNDAHHTIALDEDGYVWTWGYNGQGQLGLGHSNSSQGASRIPRSYFGGRRVVDIMAGNGNGGNCYVRTSDDFLYAWGVNSVGQCGDGSTTNRLRPVLMSNWDPLANNGIRKWQYTGASANGVFMILDGNGFIWHCGYNAFGQAGNGTTTQNNQLVKVTTTPGGSITDFWLLGVGSGSEVQYHQVFLRTNTGTTFTHGQGSSGSFTSGRNNTAAVATSPVAVPFIDNIKEVRMQGGNGTNKYTVWLLDSGRVYFQGTNGGFHQYIGTSNNINEAGGTSYQPIHAYMPPAHKVVKLLPFAAQYDVYNRPSGMGFIFSNGMIMSGGHINSSIGGTPYESGIHGFNAQANGRGAYYQHPVPITHAR